MRLSTSFATLSFLMSLSVWLHRRSRAGQEVRYTENMTERGECVMSPAYLQYVCVTIEVTMRGNARRQVG